MIIIIIIVVVVVVVVVVVKANWVGHILRRNYLLHGVIEGQMMEVKGLGRRRRRIIQLLDDFRKRRRYWELKEEAEDLKRWRRTYINRT